jgi:hypothetical protein
MARWCPPSPIVLRVVLAALVYGSLNGLALGQATTATLQGMVRDASHAILPGALFTLRDQRTGLVRTTTTDGGGRYAIS